MARGHLHDDRRRRRGGDNRWRRLPPRHPGPGRRDARALASEGHAMIAAFLLAVAIDPCAAARAPAFAHGIALRVGAPVMLECENGVATLHTGQRVRSVDLRNVAPAQWE